jgi:hypothetical protein
MAIYLTGNFGFRKCNSPEVTGLYPVIVHVQEKKKEVGTSSCLA